MSRLSVFAIVAACAVVAVSAGPAFVSIGDWGGAALEDYHKTDELAVAKQFGTTAAELDAQFVINVGDNFYYYGVWNTSDSQWNTDFEDVYTQQALMVKWYSVLGNHDYGFNPEAQLQYVSPNNNRWVMDARYYTRRVHIQDDTYITFVFLDSNPCVTAYREDDPSNWDPCGSTYPSPSDCQFHQNILAQSCTAQYNWLKTTLESVPSGDWIVGVAHHVANEIDAEDLIGELINAKMDLYLNGHAHTLTYYQLNGAGHYVTTGAGCMVKIAESEEEEEQRLKPVLKSNSYTVNQVWNQKIAGFTTHQFSDDLKSLTTTFVDYNGNNLYDFTIQKGGSAPSGSGSCKTYGCVYGKYNKCQCNSYCEKYDDCCDDYKSVCADL